MKVYAVIKDTPYRKESEIVYFSSREKALGYILGVLTTRNETPRGYDKKEESYNAKWCYNKEQLFDTKNWNVYKYVMAGGATYHIQKIDIL